MSTVYEKTDNYGLNLYGDNDPADLRDGYNGSMRAVDKALKQHLDRVGNDENVVKTLLGDNSTQKAGEAKDKWDAAATDAAAAKEKANSNASSIAVLSSRLGAFEAKTKVKYDSILAVGDSITYGTGTSSPGRDNWVRHLAGFTGANTVNNLAINNTGFIASDSSQGKYSFRQQLEQAKSQGITPECIIIAGGINDAWSSSADDVRNAAHSTLEYAATNWPDAFIWYIPSPIARCIAYNAAKRKNLGILEALVNAANGIAGVKTIPYAWEWLNPIDGISGDGIHPNDTGARMFAEFAYRSMQGETVRANRKEEKITPVDESKFRENELYVSVDNGFCKICGRIGIQKELAAFEKIFQLPSGFNYSALLAGMVSDAPSTNNVYYPSSNDGIDISTYQTLPPSHTIYANSRWQIGVS